MLHDTHQYCVNAALAEGSGSWVNNKIKSARCQNSTQTSTPLLPVVHFQQEIHYAGPNNS